MSRAVDRSSDSLLRYLGAHKKEEEKSFERIASGKRINHAADDAAGLAIAKALQNQVQLSDVGARNAYDGISATQIADSALGSASDIVSRMQELAAESANGTLSDAQRSQLDSEYQSLKSELDRISETTTFNDQKLLQGGGALTFQVGSTGDSSSQISVGLPNVNSGALGLGPSSIASQDGARAALDLADHAGKSLSQSRGDLGAASTRLDAAIENLYSSRQANEEARSRIEDADVAAEASRATASRIGIQATLAVEAQANLSAASVLKLLS